MSEPDKLVEVAIPRPFTNLFTYKISHEHVSLIKKGSTVMVPFGKSKQLHAYVVGDIKNLDELHEGIPFQSLKSVISVGEEKFSLPLDILSLCEFAKSYYGAPLGEVLNAAAPAVALGLKNKAKERELKSFSEVKPQDIHLNAEQKNSLEFLENLFFNCIENKSSEISLLKGVTGSGKTEVYIELAKKVLSKNKSVLFLVPEISLTPELHKRFEKGLGVQVALWHSSVASQKRRDQWSYMRQGKIRVALGARSSVFSPLQDLGLIIVDEEHDPSYKQEDKFRYNARDLAIYRSKLNKALCVLGSATPSFETIYNVSQGKYQSTEIKNKYFSGSKKTEVEIISLIDEPVIPGIQTVIAEKTLLEIKNEISLGNQVILFLNRRGYANFLLCGDCGHTKGCPQCSISLTHYKKKNSLSCHYCGYFEKIPLNCEKCSSKNLLPVGAGTEGLEVDIQKLLPEAKISRLDRDVVTSHTRLESIIQEFKQGKTNVLLGTQMLVKGHDFPGVTLVVVLLADTLLKWPDFRAYERAYQVLTQVSGRAGRGEKQGRVLIQAFHEENPVLDVLKGVKNENDFFQEELSMREALLYPPYSRMIKIRFEGKTMEDAFTKANYYKEFIKNEAVEILGPSEALLSKIKNIYRVDLILKSNQLKLLHQEFSKILKQWQLNEKLSLWVDVDPQHL